MEELRLQSKTLLLGVLLNETPRREGACWAKGPVCKAPLPLESSQALCRAGGSCAGEECGFFLGRLYPPAGLLSISAACISGAWA